MYAGGIDLASDRLDGNAPCRVPPLDKRTGSGEEQHHRRYDSESSKHAHGVVISQKSGFAGLQLSYRALGVSRLLGSEGVPIKKL